jgi:hypothetical protein
MKDNVVERHFRIELWNALRKEASIGDDACYRVINRAWDSLSSRLSPQPTGDVAERAEHLCARLRELECDILDDEVGRQYCGHVAPALAQLEAALSAESTEPTREMIVQSEARRLCNDVLGVFLTFEDGLREVIGNTNFTVIHDEAKRVEAALEAARTKGGEE